MSADTVLVVDGDAVARRMLRAALETDGFIVDTVETGEGALARLRRRPFSAVILGLRLPDISGLDVLARAARGPDAPPFIVLTASVLVPDAVAAMKLGAFGYLNKPVDLDELHGALHRAIEAAAAQRKTGRADPGQEDDLGLVGRSPQMLRLRQLIQRIAPTDATALITGETGTGKELIARAIHRLSLRANGPFVPLDLGAVPETLLESELFGHRRGSFTGAIRDRRGVFEEADGGTLFLDEVAALSSAAQIELLRVLQEREVRPLGSSNAVPVDFRLVVATNVDLEEEVAAGQFREDLYYRLNVIPLRVPALRRREGDVLFLANHFIARFAAKHGVDAWPISTDAAARLEGYHWPGNVRELKNAMEREVVLRTAEPGSGSFQASVPDVPGPAADLLDNAYRTRWTLHRWERELVLAVLQRNHGDKARTARQLSITRRTLYRKLKRYAAEGPLSLPGSVADTKDTPQPPGG
jgi:DNA-binding NtrC family response regulator